MLFHRKLKHLGLTVSTTMTAGSYGVRLGEEGCWNAKLSFTSALATHRCFCNAMKKIVRRRRWCGRDTRRPKPSPIFDDVVVAFLYYTSHEALAAQIDAGNCASSLILFEKEFPNVEVPQRTTICPQTTSSGSMRDEQVSSGHDKE